MLGGRLSVVQWLQIGSQMSSRSSEVYKCKCPTLGRTYISGTMWFSEQWCRQTPLISASLRSVYWTSLSSAWNVSLLWGSGCDLTTASVITCCDCQISAPEIRAHRPALKQTQWRGAAPRLCTGSHGFNTFNRTQSQPRHFCTESTRSPTHGKTTVRWYSQLTTPWELAVSHANGDQCTDSWICFSPKLLIIETTLMWRGHSSQVTLIHLLSLCFVLIWLNP